MPDGINGVVSLIIMTTLLKNLACRLWPEQRPGIFIVRLDVVLGAAFEMVHGVEDVAVELLAGQGGEDALDEVQPRRGGGREAQKGPLLPLDPVHDPGVLVGRVVAQDGVAPL